MNINYVFSLQYEVDDLTAMHAGLVSNACIEGHLATIEAGKADMRSLEFSHKQLVQRYSQLKNAIDQASKRPEESGIRCNRAILVVPDLAPVHNPVAIELKATMPSKKNMSSHPATPRKPKGTVLSPAAPSEAKSKSSSNKPKATGVPNIEELRAQIQEKIAKELEDERLLKAGPPIEERVIPYAEKDPIAMVRLITTITIIIDITTAITITVSITINYTYTWSPDASHLLFPSQYFHKLQKLI